MVEISVTERASLARKAEAVRGGVPFARGEVSDATAWSLTDVAGHAVPLAARPLARWDDGSVKWLLVDFAATAAAGGRATYRLLLGDKELPDTPDLTVEDDPEGELTVATGTVVVAFRRGLEAHPPVRVAGPAGIWEVDPLGANLELDDRDWGLVPEVVACRMEHVSSRRAVVRLEGDLRMASGDRLGQVICRVHCLAGADYLILDHTYVNTYDIRARRLCDAGVLVRHCPEAAPRAAGEARFGIDGKTRSEPMRRPEEGLRLFQTSAQRPRPLRFDQFEPQVRRSAGYASRGPAGDVVGEKLDGWVAWRQGEGQLTAAVEDLWQQHPKEVVLGPTTAIKLWVRDQTEPETLDIDWRGGVREEDISPTGAPWRTYGEDGVAKSHRVWLGFGPTATATEHEQRARAFQAPLAVGVAPERYLQTGVLGPLAPARADEFPRTEAFLQRLTEWIWRHQQEWSNWYGMLNWGGVQTHYLPLEERWTNLIERFGWINGETEPQLGVLYQYVRTGDERWLSLGRTMVRHLVDVDTVHAGERAGLMRRHFAVHFGQPGDMAHTFLGAPSLFYLLTGDERVLEVIKQVADQSMRHLAEGYFRDSTDAMKNCLYFYELTSDECYRNQAGHILDGALNAVAEDGGVGIPHDTGFHTNFYLLSGLLLWARILGPERIRDDVPRIMDYEITPRARDDEATVSRGASYEGLAFAYLQTGDRRYLYPGIKDLCGLCFTIVYQTYAPTRRFPSGNTVYYRPETGPVAPDSYTSIHGLGRLLTMIPPFLQALHDAGISEEELPVDGGICGHRGPFVRLVPPGAGLATPAWDAPAADYPGGGGEAFTVAPRWSRTRFATLDLSSLWNRKPLAADPFGYDAGAAAFPQMLEAVEQAAMGAVQDNLSGLPWGAEIITGGVPFHLARCAGPDDGGLLVLEEGKTHVIPVGFAAQRLHFFGQAATHGDMQMGVVGAVYRIRYGDGHVEELPLRNLIHYEDWRYLHYAREAPLACAWNPRAFSLVRANAEGLAASELEYIQRQLLQGDGEPRHVETPFGTHPMIEVATGRHAGEYYWFANRVTKLRHLNQFAVDTGGRDVAEIEIADAAEGHEVMLLAITAERPGEDEARGSAAQLSFSDGRASRQALSGNLPLELSAWKREPEAVWSGRSEGAVFSDSTALRLEAVPGRCHVQLTLTGGPVILRVRANGHPVVEEYHLLGSWIRDWPDPIQRLGFEVAAPEGEIEVELEADPGLLYERSWNHIGGNGWVWDAARRRWQRRVPEPWRLLAVEVELLA